MAPWIDGFKRIVKYLFYSAADSRIGDTCTCGKSPRTTRCFDCSQAPPSCDYCFIAAHKHSPCHWANKWNGAFFDKLDISALGYAITLGHDGNPCPRVDYSKDTMIDFTLVDVNGIHKTKLAFCNCGVSVDKLDQLMKAQIFPASTEAPRTGFTFNLLEMFHADCLSSKKSAYDYVSGLRHRTDGAFNCTEKVPVCWFIWEYDTTY